MFDISGLEHPHCTTKESANWLSASMIQVAYFLKLFAMQQVKLDLAAVCGITGGIVRF
jgi:hypothetical protein